jgi:hypothetical protein
MNQVTPPSPLLQTCEAVLSNTQPPPASEHVIAPEYMGG